MPAANRPRGATAIRADQSQLKLPRLPQIKLPRAYLWAGAAILVCFAIAIALPPSEEDSIQPPLEELASAEISETAANPPVDTFAPQPEPPTVEAWIEQTVRSGDNLSLIFKRAGFNDRDVHRVVSEAKDGKGLARIFPGQTIAFKADESGELDAIRHIKSPLETVTYRREGGEFESAVSTRKPVARETQATGVIESSLFMAGQQAGLSHTTIMDMANIFGGVIDFVGDPRKGDTMHLLFEEMYLDGSKFDDGNIIAASYTNQGKTYTAYRYIDSNGEAGYYNEDGVSMRKAFLLAPVDFTRISSNFNPRRIHPIYKTARPHRGTDYAAPTGTPVFAAGDGRVVKAGYSKANGNYVFLQHGEQFVTKYLHLHKRKVKQGQRVSQSQVIGTVGSTGAATGPHLHYEFLMNGVHRNPRTIHKKLPKAKSLPAAELPLFQEATAGAARQLAKLREDTDTRLAMSNPGDDRG
jgi:murein DD-endopeptidase MepM/ murein hydrolase activator NlpD